ncbi:MAG: riboflavin synthase [Acidobacteria bacterium]|nr:riboflavin synthase [Acidobacteriota bacterium]
MFTGIVEEVGAVESLKAGRLRIACKTVLGDAFEGCSIAVNGVCLTAIDISGGAFSADLAPETLRRTNLGDLISGSRVNLERPLAASGRYSGHIVQGHVDGTGTLESLVDLGAGNYWLSIRIPEDLDRYVVFKGSLAIDGISLTVASIDQGIVGVTIIPHTVENTALRDRAPGSRVNLECDVVAKYVEKMLMPRVTS